MVPSVKDQSEDIPPNNAFLVDDQILGSQSDTAYSPVDLHAPKARKPYTITKQRERWTDEEHKKFIEALKLYGRAWRRIEEHVGTKTAVQIRSHAQKFFSKVVRDSSGSHISCAEPIEIPPPRPKRKPMHPYPRKMVHPHKKGVSVPQLLLRSASPISEQEHQSPTSVLSAVGSDTLGSASSSSPTGSVSPVSSGAGISNHNSVLLSEPSALQEENISSPDPEAAGVQDDQAAEKFEFFPEDNVVPREGLGREESMRCLKLFGRTLLVTDSDRPFSPIMDVDSKPKLSDTVNGKQHVQTSPWSCGPGDCLVANSDHVWNQMEHGAAAGRSVNYTPQYPNGNSNPNEEAALHHAFLPVWAFYGRTSFHYLGFNNPESLDKAHQEFNVGAAQGKEVQKEGSWSGSNAESVCEVGNGDKNWDMETQSCQISSDREEKEHPSECRSKQIEKLTSRCRKGFVPYKRCLAERDTQSSTVSSEGGEQRIRLCL